MDIFFAPDQIERVRNKSSGGATILICWDKMNAGLYKIDSSIKLVIHKK